MPRSNLKNMNNMTVQDSTSSIKPTSPIGIFCNENSLDEPEDIVFKRTKVNFLKKNSWKFQKYINNTPLNLKRIKNKNLSDI